MSIAGVPGQVRFAAFGLAATLVFGMLQRDRSYALAETHVAQLPQEDRFSREALEAAMRKTPKP